MGLAFDAFAGVAPPIAPLLAHRTPLLASAKTVARAFIHCSGWG